MGALSQPRAENGKEADTLVELRDLLDSSMSPDGEIHGKLAEDADASCVVGDETRQRDLKVSARDSAPSSEVARGSASFPAREKKFSPMPRGAAFSPAAVVRFSAHGIKPSEPRQDVEFCMMETIWEMSQPSCIAAWPQAPAVQPKPIQVAGLAGNPMQKADPLQMRCCGCPDGRQQAVSFQCCLHPDKEVIGQQIDRGKLHPERPERGKSDSSQQFVSPGLQPSPTATEIVAKPQGQPHCQQMQVPAELSPRVSPRRGRRPGGTAQCSRRGPKLSGRGRGRLNPGFRSPAEPLLAGHCRGAEQGLRPRRWGFSRRRSASVRATCPGTDRVTSRTSRRGSWS